MDLVLYKGVEVMDHRIVQEIQDKWGITQPCLDIQAQFIS